MTVKPDNWRAGTLDALAPQWLSLDAPHSDVALSSRFRVMRNIRGYRFPHHESPERLIEVCDRVIAAAPGFEIHRKLTRRERDALTGCRLISPEFAAHLPGRAVLLDPPHECSVMINEEDHIRLQGVTAGWSIKPARRSAEAALEILARGLEFARDDRFGFLAASPFNCGEGRRLSAMFHLIGLASTKRLPSVLQVFPARGLAVRGLFGESSRAIGAFVQVSTSGGSQQEFIGACDYLIGEERAARREFSGEVVLSKTLRAIEFAIPARRLSLADALRVIAWIRWASAAGAAGFVSARTVDAWLTALDVRGGPDEAESDVKRAQFLRARIEAELKVAY